MKWVFAADGRTINRFEIEVENSDTVLQIKEKIQNSRGIPISDQTLIFKGNILRDDITVQVSGVEDQSRIRLVIRKVPEINEQETDDDEDTAALVPKKKMKTEAADMNSNTIPIQLKLPAPSSDLVKLTVNADQTVPQLKRLIASTIKELETTSESAHRLVIRNEEGIDMPDDKTLSDYQISPESVVTVEIRPPPPKMSLLLKIPGSDEFLAVEICGEDTIRQLKEIIHESEGTPVDRISIKDDEGNELSDHKMLISCGIMPDSELAVEYQRPTMCSSTSSSSPPQPQQGVGSDESQT
ncbi:hypothetical protein C2S53_008276 [Perilla frutescens var. hirtella]|uniref:Ubiquitin-like domain-containing protein n=1 Tax=Perilla frutescens var. hirtella TaxID=608512 RepID=A0AAD4PAI4_PERFH|nr:hypothetical protein C2S53_008276 [Perilla frutescens var. hirtella]